MTYQVCQCLGKGEVAEGIDRVLDSRGGYVLDLREEEEAFIVLDKAMRDLLPWTSLS